MWSRIKDTELELQAYMIMNENQIRGCSYHNNNHIEDMYKYLSDTNEPYDEALDWAVLFHDIVYDSDPKKELRSAQLFMDFAQTYRGCVLNESEKMRVYDLILATASHTVISETVLPGNSAIIRADLHALTDKTETTKNFVKIMGESMALYKCTIEEFATNNINFMRDLRKRICLNSYVDKDHEEFYNKVSNGINLTIRLAKAIKDTK